MSSRPRLAVVAAARPNFMKVAPVMQALKAWIDLDLIHTGQHYDRAMSSAFFEELDLFEPDVNLGVGSGSHAVQTAGVMVALEKRLTEVPVDALLVVGDVNSTLASALTAAKMGIPVAHVEAGLRSRDWSMPEEINRVLTDRLSTWLFTPSSDADANLVAEGIPLGQIHLVGNVMIDTLLAHLPRARRRAEALQASLGLEADYALLTLHRPSNVDDRSTLSEMMEAISQVSKRLPVVFPMHPRTETRMRELDIRLPDRVLRAEPFGYTDFLALMQQARLVLTDSGGIQEETSVLGVPCVTLRDSTERPITCTLGTNIVAGTRAEDIVAASLVAIDKSWEPADIPLWDGRASERVAAVLVDSLLGANQQLKEMKMAGEVV
ncbi:MAG: UDP-N-acetylglucosamine 2-epimerase (non-hydrolyzing) [Acidimicrobiia bacterium]